MDWGVSQIIWDKKPIISFPVIENQYFRKIKRNQQERKDIQNASPWMLQQYHITRDVSKQSDFSSHRP